MKTPLQPVTLHGQRVRLVPMQDAHLDALAAIAQDEDLFKGFAIRPIGRDGMRAFVAGAITDRARGTALPFVTLDAATGAVIGSTRFGAIEPAHRKLEIGWTFLARSHQRTGANREAKLLMLTHAFEALNCVRVEFKTDSENTQSRAALAGIGAVEEGTLRNHMIMDTGRRRHSVYFSILDSEWPGVKQHLRRLLDR